MLDTRLLLLDALRVWLDTFRDVGHPPAFVGNFESLVGRFVGVCFFGLIFCFLLEFLCKKKSTSVF